MPDPRERIQKITIQAFRGVREELEIDLGGESLVLYGPNGTGKSTIADAIEWYATDSVEFLAREGRKDGLRHSGASPSMPTAVTVDTGGSFGGTRMSAKPRADKATDRTTAHFLLRGRTLADFMDKSKTEKWKALTPIMGMEQIEGLRRELQRARNDLSKVLKTSQGRDEAVAEQLEELGVRPAEWSILTALRQRSAAVGLAGPDSIEAVAGGTWQPAEAASTPEQQRRRDLQRLIDDIEAAERLDVVDPRLTRWHQHCTQVDQRAAAHLTLMRAADAYLRTSQTSTAVHQCPLCDAPVDGTELASRVSRLLLDLQEQHTESQQTMDEFDQVVDEATQAARRRADQQHRAEQLGISLPAPPDDLVDLLRAARTEREPVADAEVEAGQRAVTAWDHKALAALNAALPQPGDERDRHLFELWNLLNRARAWIQARAATITAQRAHDLAKRVFAAYDLRQRSYVETVIGWISAGVEELYRQLHPPQTPVEVGSVRLAQQSNRGVELSIAFHGSEQRVPQGVLSESYLNSLGIAVFLAMARVFNPYGFLVLDDVISSFDAEHRARFAQVLVTQLADWQVIVLTHDQVFYEQLKEASRGWKTKEIVGWSHKDGPRLRDQTATIY